MAVHQGRYPELDACRGIAIVMMIIFHFFVDLVFLGIPGPDPFAGFFRGFGLCTAILFVGIAGVSANIKISKTPDLSDQILSFFRRGVFLLLIGFGITLVTWWILNGHGFVVFGILHLIGVSLILAPFLHRLGYYGIVCAAILLLISYSGILPSGPLWMAWSGMYPTGFYSVDYTPLIPWLSVFLIGLSLGNYFYSKNSSGYLNHFHDSVWMTTLSYLGKKSLLIYLIHQPILITLLILLSGKSIV